MKEYNSIHSFYYTYHKTHNTDHLLKYVESEEEARQFFKRVGEDLQQASKEIRKLGDFTFKKWISDPWSLILFFLFLVSMTIMIGTDDKIMWAISALIMMYSGITAIFPLYYAITEHCSYRKLIKAARKFQDDRFFKGKSEQKMVNDANYFIAKQNKIWEENQATPKDEA